MTSEPTGHFTDADFVRYLDDELPADQRASRHSHLAACAACAGELDTLREESRRVSTWLLRYDDAMTARGALSGSLREARPRRVGVPSWLKAAAALLLVTVPAVAVPGVRQWIVERVVEPATGPASTPEAAPGVPASTDAAPARVVRFVPAPGPFTVRFDAPDPGGSLALRRVDAGEEGVLRLEGDAEPVVSAGTLRVRNAGASGRYVLELPRETTTVRVRVGGRDVSVDAGGLDRGVVVPLGTEGDAP